MKKEGAISRRYIRAKPDPLEVAYISFNEDHSSTFSPDIVALIVDESAMGGCGVVVLKNELSNKFKIRTHYILKIGQLEPLHSELVYVGEVNKDLIRLGFKFLE